MLGVLQALCDSKGSSLCWPGGNAVLVVALFAVPQIFKHCLGDFGECFLCGQREGFCAQGCSRASSECSLWVPGSQPHLSARARTALMLGCEYGCKDAVEVLLRNGADAALTDGLGHDCAYYARIGDNIDILALIKAALEDSSRGRRNLHPLPLGGNCPCVCRSCSGGQLCSFDHRAHKILLGRGKAASGLGWFGKAFEGVAGSGASSINHGSYLPLFI